MWAPGAGCSTGTAQPVVIEIGDIKIVRTQKYTATTNSNHTFSIAPNLLDQDFSADDPNLKWAGGISYIRTSDG